MTKKERLIRRLKLGDEKAFKEVFELWNAQLYGVAVDYLHDRKLAEDAVQDVFVKLWNYRSKLDPTRSLEGFLFTLIKNRVLSMIRADKRRINKRIAFSFYRNKKSMNQTEDSVIFSEYQSIFSQALQELPSGKRKVYELRSKGYNNREIASELDIKFNTVKSRYYEACLFLRKYMDHHAGIEKKRAVGRRMD